MKKSLRPLGFLAFPNHIAGGGIDGFNAIVAPGQINHLARGIGHAAGNFSPVRFGAWKDITSPCRELARGKQATTQQNAATEHTRRIRAALVHSIILHEIDIRDELR